MREAKEHSHGQIESEHLLLALLRDEFGDGDAVQVDARDGKIVFA
jgi:hypothetical protein